jgi:hypothetical protein
MTVGAALDAAHPSEEAAARQGERRALGVACGAHVLHDGYTDLVWVALPIWQAEFSLSYAAVGLLRTVYSGTLASLQIPAAAFAARIGAATVLAAGTALAGLCYCLAGISSGFSILVLALLLGGIGAATQHPIASALVTRTFSGARSLRMFGTYNFAGDVGKVPDSNKPAADHAVAPRLRVAWIRRPRGGCDDWHFDSPPAAGGATGAPRHWVRTAR